MKRGRKPAIHAEEFNAMVCNRREFFGYSLAALANISGVNRGTLSEFFSGKRNGFGYDDRLKLIKALGMGPDAEERFLDEKHRLVAKSPLLLLDPPTSPHPPLERGQHFLICANYPEAKREFEAVYRSAADCGDYGLQADAAARLAWTYYEQGLYRQSQQWASDGIRLITIYTGTSFAQIMDSIRPGSRSSLCPLNLEAAHVLDRLLHIRAKVYIESVVYCGGEHLRERAAEAIEQAVTLVRHLQIPAALGHDIRWQAVLTISSMEPDVSRADRLLSECAEQFPLGSLGAAYLARDRGIFHWQTEHYAQSRGCLMEAINGLASYADSRALAPALCVLSRVAMQSGADDGVVRRYAVAGAVLNPYGFVLDNAIKCIRTADPRGLRRDIEKVLSGHQPFEVVEPVLSRLSNGSALGEGTQRMEQNLTKILGTDVHSWLHNSPVRPHA